MSGLVLLAVAAIVAAAAIPGGVVGISSHAHSAPSMNDEKEWIKRILVHLDDDHDGKISLTETEDAISNELGSHVKHNVDDFHKGDAELVEDELFENWKTNPVRNWAGKDVLEWAKKMNLSSCLPGLLSGSIVGKDLAHLATSEHFIKNVCPIVADRKRLQLRSLDLVMFGPSPADSFPMIMSVIAAVAVGIAVVVLFISHKKNKELMTELGRVSMDQGAISDLERKLEDYEVALTETTSKAQELETQNSIKDQAVNELDDLREELEFLKKQQVNARLRLKEILRAAYVQETELLNLAKSLTQDRKLKAQKEVDKLDSQRRSILGVVRLTNSVKASECEGEMHTVLEMYRLIGTIAHERTDRWQHLQKLLDFRVSSRSPSAKAASTSQPTSTSPITRRKPSRRKKVMA
eukprot:m.8849 g.8849  ORF g.8849 m.8849 type:complete len:408 (+) comp3273_c0_seq1:101-1324(+)